MLKSSLLVLCLATAGCAIHDPNDVVGRVNREFDKGEKLMIACQKNEQKCPKYQAFKEQWEREVNHYTTFESALANHRARVAYGYDL
jgi:hypothetical protein